MRGRTKATTEDTEDTEDKNNTCTTEFQSRAASRRSSPAAKEVLLWYSSVFLYVLRGEIPLLALVLLFVRHGARHLLEAREQFGGHERLHVVQRFEEARLAPRRDEAARQLQVNAGNRHQLWFCGRVEVDGQRQGALLDPNAARDLEGRIQQPQFRPEIRIERRGPVRYVLAHFGQHWKRRAHRLPDRIDIAALPGGGGALQGGRQFLRRRRAPGGPDEQAVQGFRLVGKQFGVAVRERDHRYCRVFRHAAHCGEQFQVDVLVRRERLLRRLEFRARGKKTRIERRLAILAAQLVAVHHAVKQRRDHALAGHHLLAVLEFSAQEVDGRFSFDKQTIEIRLRLQRRGGQSLCVDELVALDAVGAKLLVHLAEPKLIEVAGAGALRELLQVRIAGVVAHQRLKVFGIA